MSGRLLMRVARRACDGRSVREMVVAAAAVEAVDDHFLY